MITSIRTVKILLAVLPIKLGPNRIEPMPTQMHRMSTSLMILTHLNESITYFS